MAEIRDRARHVAWVPGELDPDWWAKHGELDRKRTRYDELLAGDRAPDEQELTIETFQRKYEAVQRAVPSWSRSWPTPRSTR